MPTGSKILREIPTISGAEKIQRADNTLQQKIRIFKENEQTEANKKRDAEHQLFYADIRRTLHTESRNVRNRRRCQNQKNQFYVPAHIKIVRRDQQQYPTEFMRQAPIQAYDQRQKQ